MNKVAVIGGGAAGLVAAIAAADAGASVTVFERLDRVGKKLLVTGNGRCNLTNTSVSTTNYHGDKRFIKAALTAFSPEDTLSFFKQLGLITRTENGKIYPYSLQAGTVVDLFRFTLNRRGISLKTGVPISEVPSDFILDGERFNAVIVACGGKASAHLGSDGSGYRLLTAFGHDLSELSPAITQIKTEPQWVRPLKGIKFDGTAAIMKNGRILREESGEILFTDYGLSGPPILQLSRIAGRVKNTQIALDLMPEYAHNALFALLKQHRRLQTDRFEDFFTGILNKRLGQTVVKYAGFSLNDSAESLSNQDIGRLTSAVKGFVLPVVGVKGFENAQVTAGGIETAQFGPDMQSKYKPGLYAAGEILDVDGDCGGFNLQWAFSSGYIAGKSAAGGNYA